MKKILFIVLALILMSCGCEPQHANTSVATWEDSKQIEKEKQKQFKIGDVVKFKHEDKILGVVNSIHTSNGSQKYVDIYVTYDDRVVDFEYVRIILIEKVEPNKIINP